MITTNQHTSIKTFQNYINAKWVPSEASRAYERRNPANFEDVIGLVPAGSAEEINDAVVAASAAGDAWSSVPAPSRSLVLSVAARLLADRRDEIARLITREQGKTFEEASGEVTLGVTLLEYMAGEGRRLNGLCLPSESKRRFVYASRQAVGIVGLITPWNFPLGVPLWKIAPALACGNTLVWKPSRLTPLTSAAIVDLFADAGVPRGVLNLVNGAGATAGAALVKHPAVRAVSFTASLEVAKTIDADAAALFKKVQVEAGSKNAVVVFADADLDWAAECIVAGAFRYAGQRCTATSRVVAVNEVADALVAKLVALTRAIRVGNGMDPEVTMGPISDEAQMHRILDAIEAGTAEGQLITGGRRLEGGQYSRGLFLEPTLFDHVAPDAQIAQDEIFGPVLTISRVADPEAALDAANKSRYGMTAAIFSRDAEMLTEAAERLQCGSVHCNAPTIGAEAHIPFGGIKCSGVGDREMGGGAIDFYSELKVVYMNRNRPQLGTISS